jgi:hypothetical protein
MRHSQPADRAQRDDEQVRHSRVDAESIATATRFTVVSHITDVATIVITPTRHPRADEPNGRANARPLRFVSVIPRDRSADKPKNRWNFNLKLEFRY